ncbi:MAG: polysaccharide deacetylase family protein [Cohaesibacteraceae bacterium]
MSSTRTKIMQNGLRALHAMGMHRWLRPMSEGMGMILTLHRVRPAAELDASLGAFTDFAPNALLEITPEFLDTALEALKADGLALISMDEVVEALSNPIHERGRFAALTFDDGYIDNRDHALPVLEAHQAPATVYMPSDYPQGKGELWWVALEEMIRAAKQMVQPLDRDKGSVSLETAEDKLAFYLDVYWALRAIDQDTQRATVRQMAEDHGYDLEATCKALILSTPELIDLADHPLITIGAHTVTHRAIAKLSPEDAMAEMVEGANWLEANLGKRPDHFAFPYGDPGSAAERDFGLAEKAGFKSAVTTRKGMLYRDHADHLFGLPRVSLNGAYQDTRYIELFASGAPFLLANGFKKVA